MDKELQDGYRIWQKKNKEVKMLYDAFPFII